MTKYPFRGKLEFVGVITEDIRKSFAVRKIYQVKVYLSHWREPLGTLSQRLKTFGRMYPASNLITGKVGSAKAMTKLSENRYQFGPKEVRRCKEHFGRKDTLSELYKEKLDGYELNKPKLLDILFGFIISNIDNEFDIDGKAKRDVVEVIGDVLSLSIKNSDFTFKI